LFFSKTSSSNSKCFPLPSIINFKYFCVSGFNFLYYGYNGGNALEIQKRLAVSKVTVIGCGGIGTHMAYYLATSGIGTITLIDNDDIELSNLTRQVLFKESDIGERKTKILKRELLKRNHEVFVNTIEIQLNSMESISALPSSDLYIVSADTPDKLIDWVNEACALKQQAYINVGYINDISTVGPFYIPQETACIKCTSIMPDMDCDKKEKEDIIAINKDFRPATFPGVNGVAAAYAFTDIIKYLGDFGEVLTKNKRIGIHSASPKIEIQNLYKNKECPICEIKQS